MGYVSRHKGFLLARRRDGRVDVIVPHSGEIIAEKFDARPLAMDWIDREWPEGAPKN